MKDGKKSECKKCYQSLRKEYDIEYYLKNKPKKNTQRKSRYNLNIKLERDQALLYYYNHKEKRDAYSKKYKIDNKQQIKNYNKQYLKNNRQKIYFSNSKRRAAKLKRTPFWVNLNKIKEIYLNCPIGYAVDHIVPLQGKNVSGLHVSWNLQYLTPTDNSIKKNKFDGTSENKSWK